MLQIGACLLIGSSSLAHAASWVAVAKSSDETASIYVDTASIRFSGARAKAWFLEDNMYSLDVPAAFPATRYVSSKKLLVFDCDQRTWATTQAVFYDDHAGSGKVVWSWSAGPARLQYVEIVPDTMGEAMLDSACLQRRRGKSPRSAPSPAM
ncbi:surface-adhesin E family protein [Burkholderia ambifaria]|uniref:surface-adhesin E family protein n=1 Tax=Burkholderia ambifaria TaxID=152480 RepID=UPI003D1602DD